MSDRQTSGQVGAVVIGRNEGARLVACLGSVAGQVDHLVYVDSGSLDGSCETARATGADVISLDPAQPFTAARARNAGVAQLCQTQVDLTYVQLIDGDCELRAGWVAAAVQFLETHPDAAVVFGRRRERFPQASVYNRLIDQEWDGPAGQTLSCGGDALIRVSAFQAVGGFNAGLIAGEEPELCLRLRAAGWSIWRLDAEMTLHDADLHRFSQWWTRNRRAGHAYAEGSAMHGGAPHFHGVRETRSALFWCGALPLVAVAGIVVSPWSLVLLLGWPLNVVRLGLRDRNWQRALLLSIGKLPEAQGMFGYFWNRFRNVRRGLIEYK